MKKCVLMGMFITLFLINGYSMIPVYQGLLPETGLEINHQDLGNFLKSLEIATIPATEKQSIIHFILETTKNTTMKDSISGNHTDSLRQQKALLSTLWAFVTLNYLYCDVAGLMDANMLAQYLTGTVGGMAMTPGMLLVAGILMEIPMFMVLGPRILNERANRIANITAGILMTTVQLATLFAGPVTAYYAFFSVVEIATTSYITWYSWKKLKKSNGTNESI